LLERNNATLIRETTLPYRVGDDEVLSSRSKRQKKREKSAPMPAASAGLLRFFEEETQGMRIRPELVILLTVGLILACVLAQLYALGKLPFL